MRISAIGISVVTLVFASACGVADDGSQSSNEAPWLEGTPAIAEESVDEGETVEGDVQALHQFDVQGTTYTYLLDGEDVMLHVRTSKTAPRVSVQTATGAEPTFLEIFNALQPGAEPHEALVASHREAVEALGREGAAVLPSSIVSLVEKTQADLDDCRSYFLPVWGGGFGGGTPVVNTLEGTAAGTTLQAASTTIAQRFMAAGACNFAATVSRRVAFDKRINAGGSWATQLTANIAVNDANYIVHNPSAQSVNLRSRMVDAANNGMQLVTARRQ